MELFDLNKLGILEEGTFIKRLNRFTGLCKIKEKRYTCHIADTGRLKEILIEGRNILLVKNRPELKTDYKLISAKMEDGWILLNTSIHSKIGFEAIKKGILGFTPKNIKTEVKFGRSRIDYLIDNKVFVELKGSNLLINKTCIFPDAPTIRGSKHIRELIEAKKQGYEAYILIMGLRNCSCFYPNRKLDPRFSDLFFKAVSSGVVYSGFKIKLKEDGKIILNGKMPLCKNLS